MAFKTIKIITLFAFVSYSIASFSHSAMYKDNFTYDNTNEGLSAAAIKMLSGQLAPAFQCINGFADGYPCHNVDLRSFLSKQDMGGGSNNLNDIWGWTDPVTGDEIAIVGRTHGTAFVNITDPDNPVHIGFLRGHANGTDSWRDMKVYNDHVFIVADGGGNRNHGLQVYDLTGLRNTPPNSTLTETAHLDGFGAAHNIAINEDTGFAYIVGSNQCSGGLYMVDVSNPTSPSFAGCFSSDGYTHDTQCVVYNGPDTTYVGREICVGYNEDTITIVDVTNKSNPVQISRKGYQGSRYTHQGWFLDATHTTLILNDELDEQRNNINTTSYIWDVSNLSNPVEIGRYVGPTAAIDHNLYTRDGLIYETNYRAGLRILSTDNIASGVLEEVAYFDTIPGSNSAQFSGTWSSYIYFESGNVILSDIGTGLFVVKPNLNGPPPPPPPPPIEYCDAAGNNASEEWISQVQVGSFVNNSGSATYSDFTNQFIPLGRGDTPISLTPEYSGQNYNEYWRVWIDFNGNGTFESNEIAFDSGSATNTQVNGQLNVPSTVENGQTRMRVIMRYNTAPSACGNFNYGEVEDYTVEISGDAPPPPPPPPPPETFENNNTYNIPDNNSTGVTSPIDVTREGASGSIAVEVDITHTYKGDLVVDLIHPDGTVYNLHNRTGGSANNIQETYNVNVGSKDSLGNWRLRVRDLARRDIGTINRWSITF